MSSLEHETGLSPSNWGLNVNKGRDAWRSWSPHSARAGHRAVYGHGRVNTVRVGRYTAVYTCELVKFYFRPMASMETIVPRFGYLSVPT
jgi:hypothetical protein